LEVGFVGGVKGLSSSFVFPHSAQFTSGQS
jgi:hypothetical protein